ncbi:cell wall protein RBR3-like [Photinus pyralis]|uniref:cell wall protein RBR3-like n=1 Tax=Photinus pyralis TaxID=7054 RepID=UPI0012674BF4|nr:cell wall protein RBR3-like [Photinus pyralis]
MRRASQSRLQTQMSEPLIVVEESDAVENNDRLNKQNCSEGSSSEGSPTNPYLLSPWRQDVRKHSLPTPQCSGITASQVRRLSERSGESAAQSAREAAFLATLSTNPVSSPGGRRHSVVTISKVPTTLFGRNRRESVAASPSPGVGNRVLSARRESFAGPPSTEPRGSLHNLQLDIMDDIVRARKVRMKMWNTSNEKVCEVEALDDQGGVQRYTNSSGRRYSDFVGTTLTPIPSSSKRRGSELPPTAASTSGCTQASKLSTGIVCSNTDLISILSSRTSSAMDINQCDSTTERSIAKTTNLEQKRSRLKSSRSNSFDISSLHIGDNSQQSEGQILSAGSSNWFNNRHQPISAKTNTCKATARVTFANENETLNKRDSRNQQQQLRKEGDAVLWDEKSGSTVDPHLLGSAIEVFLRRGGPEPGEQSPTLPTSVSSPSKGAIPKTASKNTGTKSKTGWFSGKGDESDFTETCDSSTLCSTLKDLFVK